MLCLVVQNPEEEKRQNVQALSDENGQSIHSRSCHSSTAASLRSCGVTTGGPETRVLDSGGDVDGIPCSTSTAMRCGGHPAAGERATSHQHQHGQRHRVWSALDSVLLLFWVWLSTEMPAIPQLGQQQCWPVATTSSPIHNISLPSSASHYLLTIR